jgi:hypothetical protein
MKKLFAGGFLFIGGAILMSASAPALGEGILYIGFACAFAGMGMMVYSLFSKNDEGTK